MHEERRARSREDLGFLFEQNPMPMLVFDLETLAVLEANAAAQRFYGYTRAEILALTARELQPPELAEGFAFRPDPPDAGFVHRGEKRHRHHDGSILEVEVTSQQIRFRGRVARLVLVTDISARLQATRRLLRLQEVTAALAEARTPGDVAAAMLHQGIETLGARSGLVAVLEAEGGVLRLIGERGYPPELLHRYDQIPLETPFPLADAVRDAAPIFLRDAAEREACYPHLEELRRSNGEGALATVPMVADGETIGVLALNFPTPCPWHADDRAFVLSLAQLCAQAMHRARLYEAAQSATRRMARIADQQRLLTEAGLAINSVRTLEERLQAIADQARRVLGAERAACRLEAAAAPAVPEVSTRGDGGSPASGDGYLAAPLLARGGERLGTLEAWGGEMGASAVEDRAALAQLAQLAAVAIENARLYDRAEQASRAKSEFLAVMSHELRTPLNAILGYADLMKMGIPDPLPPATLQSVDRVEFSAQHLLQLIEEILTLTRVEAGREPLNLETVDVGLLLREVEGIISPLAQQKGLCLQVCPPPEQLRMQTDERKLRQILLNLCGNAVKFTEHGRVELAARVEGEQLLIVVRDTGIGIAPQDQARIFEPFWQVDQQATRRCGGTGLGLAVSQRLAQLMGGGLEVRSEPGRGSEFRLCLPLHAPHAASVA